ncbi:hypothetical protein WJX72_006921 [[Myrmecia] bisecta]|uniref:Uncharacterized protein n=1 Tax=[Myrmecia] bisecta TaxID=41462 RepID=A0AAW1R6L1_9CHLO
MWLSGVRLAFYHSQVPARLIVVLTIVALMVLYNVCVAALIRWRTRSSLEYLRHEAVKTMVSLVGATMAMVSVLLEEPGEMGLAGAPLPLMTIHAWIVPFYQLRVTTARTLHLFMYLNFLIMLLGRSWLASHYQAQLGPFSWGQVLTGLLTSVVAPLALSSVLEAGCRSAFLRDLRDRTRGQLPPPDLGPTWRRVLPSLGTQQGLMRAALAFW